MAQYRGAEPRPSLENRILAQLHAEQKALPWLAWVWRVGATLAAAGVIVGLLSIAHRHLPSVPASVAESPKPTSTPGFEKGQEQVAHTSRPSNSAAVSVAASNNRRVSEKRNSALPLALVGRNGLRLGASAAHHDEGPRRDAFPSPAPLSEEEKLLVSYVRQLPEGTLAAFPENDQPLASLSVPDLNIPPLVMKELPSTITDEVN
jgi:hypothetical protein